MAKGCIFAKGEILSVLSVLDREYKKAYGVPTPSNVRLMKTYAKMSVIAAGGWVEDGLRDLMDVSISKLKSTTNQTKIQRMVRDIHGFSYSRHFSRGVIMTFGAQGLEFIELCVGDSDISRLASSLGNIKTWRDDVAHSHAAVITCDPSRVTREVGLIFPILKKIERSARLYRKKHFD